MHLWLQNNVKDGPFKRLWKHKVEVRRDGILVMAEGEDELRRLVTGVIYAVQRRPWFREIDLWRSFVNVDLDFLEQLEERWLD